MLPPPPSPRPGRRHSKIRAPPIATTPTVLGSSLSTRPHAPRNPQRVVRTLTAAKFETNPHDRKGECPEPRPPGRQLVSTLAHSCFASVSHFRFRASHFRSIFPPRPRWSIEICRVRRELFSDRKRPRAEARRQTLKQSRRYGGAGRCNVLETRRTAPDRTNGTGRTSRYDTASPLVEIDNRIASGYHRYGDTYENAGSRMTAVVSGGGGTGTDGYPGFPAWHER